MMTWLVILGVMAAFSVAALKLFSEDQSDRNGVADRMNSQGATSDSTRLSRWAWERMSDSDLDALINEFSTAGEPAVLAKSKLS